MSNSTTLALTKHLRCNRNRKVIFPTLHEKDIITGSILGQGSFSTVREVKEIHQDYSKSDTSSISSGSTCTTQSRDDIDKTDEIDEREHAVHYRYAIKQVRKDLSSNDRIDACIDLKNEARFLSALCHPNIINIHGIGEIQVDSSAFLLLEKISHTLATQHKVWAFQKKMMVKNKFMRTRNRKRTSSLWNERIEVAMDLANVMSYLHNLDIVFRDLKPANCGFDMDGVFKLFDFGLATHLTPEKRIEKNQYHLTGGTGSGRYMAPEVARHSLYGKPCDIYSFAILLWEILSLKTAFEGETRDSHAIKVYGYRNCRPAIKSNWPFILRQLLCDSWSVDVSERPSFNQIKLFLGHNLKEL